MGLSNKQILFELEEHNDFFDMLVDMIPTKLYIAEANDDGFYNPKYMKKPSTDSKESRKAAAKLAKRQKLDPAAVQTNTEILKKKADEIALPNNASNQDDKSNTENVLSPNQSRIEALRAKLHARMEEKRGQRPLNPDEVSKRAARRAEKKRRQEQVLAKKTSNKSTTKVSNLNSTLAIIVPPTTPESTAEELLKMDFSRIAGLNKDLPYSKANKALANLSKPKNLKKMLQDAEAKKQRLEELKKGSTEDKSKAEQLLWKDTLQEADGQRVKDDPTKLKKAIKRKEAQKKKSQKAWKSRMQATKTAAAERQAIRNHNLQKRKVGGAVGANLSRKEIKDVSTTETSGRRTSRAGFEGRKQEFLGKGSRKE